MTANLIIGGLIGTDEAGKGDYFGPLVCAACYIDEKILPNVVSLGVRDCKKVGDSRVKEIAAALTKHCPHSVVVIGPERYNQLYEQMRNLNRLLAWAHARAIENLLAKVNCHRVLADQFADRGFLLAALQQKGRRVKLIQQTRAESNIAVAAASILARAEFLRRLGLLSEKYGCCFPKGAGKTVDEALASFVSRHGQATLRLVAKVHFRNTSKVLG